MDVIRKFIDYRFSGSEKMVYRIEQKKEKTEKLSIWWSIT